MDKPGSHDHYELMDQFEMQFKHLRLDREDRNEFNYSRSIFYQDGLANDLFKAFRAGYVFGEFMHRDGA